MANNPSLQQKTQKMYVEHLLYQVVKKLSETTRVMAKEANFKTFPLANDETIWASIMIKVAVDGLSLIMFKSMYS